MCFGSQRLLTGTQEPFYFLKTAHLPALSFPTTWPMFHFALLEGEIYDLPSPGGRSLSSPAGTVGQ